MELAQMPQRQPSNDRPVRGQYLYQSLDPGLKEIRLLVLKAGGDNDILCCDLKHAFLKEDDKPVYETISYVWGDPTKRAEIMIDGELLDVPSSAEEALRRMRHPHQERVLWIDAVCINQADLEERSAQVAIMSEIFSNTKHNLAWLGEDDGWAHAAKQAIQAVVDDARKETDDFTYLHGAFEREDGSSRFSSIGLSVNVDYAAIERLFACTYFHRLWIVQEAALAPASTCNWGTVSIALHDVLLAAKWLHYKFVDLPFSITDTPGILCAYMMWDYSDQGRKSPWYEPTPLLGLLMKGRFFDSRDPRDHVYGLMGLYRSLHGVVELPDVLTPDYTRSLNEVFRDATRACITEQNPYNALYGFSHLYCTRSGHADADASLPTWVPQWHLKFSPSIDVASFSDAYQADHNEMFDRVQMQRGPDPNVLIVRGVMIDTVRCTSSILDRDGLNNGASLLDLLRSTQDMSAQCTALSDKPAETPSLALTLNAGVGHLKQMMTAGEAEAGLTALLGFVNKTVEDFGWNAFPKDDSGMFEQEYASPAHYFQSICVSARNRRVFVTTRGLLGLGPQRVEKGDVVAVLFSCQWPVILRPMQQDGHYTILETAYVDGIMFGEAVEQSRREGKEDVTFHLH